MLDEEILERARRAAPPRYEPREVLGSGAMGHVVRAWDADLERFVALKLIVDRGPGAEEAQKRFIREARALAALDDDRLVRIFDVDAERGLLVLELVEGRSLRAMLESGQTIDVTRARAIAVDVLDALAAVHDASIVHRDVKPGNVLVDDETGRAKLADFGIAAAEANDLTKTGTAVGTPGYMAPEQLRGRAVDARADVYGLAATLFEAVTGEGLHDEERTVAQVRARLRDRTGDTAFARAVARAASPRREERFATAAAFRAALEGAERSTPAPNRLIVAAGIAALVGVVVFLNRGPDEPAPKVVPSGEVSVERYLSEAKTDLDEHRIADAIVALESAARVEPEHPEPHYYLALARWWMSAPKADIERHIARALEVGQVERRRSFLNGLRLLIEQDYARAIDYFERARKVHPEDREIAYGLFEARFHGGRPKDAVRVYVEIVDAQPKFSLGMMHAFSYALVSRDAELGAWVLEHVRPEDDPGLLLWPPRWKVATGAHAEAVAELESLEGKVAAALVRRGRIEALALGGDLEAATTAFVASDHPSERLLRASLLFASKQADAVDAERRSAVAAAKAEPRLPATFDFWLQAVQFDAARGAKDEVASSMALLAATLDEVRRRDPRRQMVSVLAASVLEDEAALVELAAVKHPEVSSAAAAALADRRGEHERAAQLWLESSSRSADGRFLVATLHRAAMSARRAGLEADARAACRGVVNAPLLTVDWGLLVGDCAAR